MQGARGAAFRCLAACTGRGPQGRARWEAGTLSGPCRDSAQPHRPPWRRRVGCASEPGCGHLAGHLEGLTSQLDRVTVVGRSRRREAMGSPRRDPGLCVTQELAPGLWIEGWAWVPKPWGRGSSWTRCPWVGAPRVGRGEERGSDPGGGDCSGLHLGRKSADGGGGLSQARGVSGHQVLEMSMGRPGKGSPGDSGPPGLPGPQILQQPDQCACPSPAQAGARPQGQGGVHVPWLGHAPPLSSGKGGRHRTFQHTGAVLGGFLEAQDRWVCVDTHAC